MTIKEAIEKLQKLPSDAKLMVADMGIGGLVEVEDFVAVDETWVDVMWSQD